MTNKIKNFLNRIIILSVFFSVSSCQVGRFVFYNFADIKDHKKFRSRHLSAPPSSFHFQVATTGKIPQKINGISFEKFIEDNQSVAFLIIRKDSILFEKYFQGYNPKSIVPSFSMAKSITSILIGCAIDDGLIKSVHEPITNYIPELSINGFDKVSIQHLLQMTSGIKFKESYINPFGDAASFYYGLKLRKEISKMKVASEPGKTFKYASGNTQLLGLVLERALKGKKITSYLQEKLWTPLEMEYDASWSIDRKKNGLEKTFCCVNARARDYAKIGRLYMHNGSWNGKQIVPKTWVEESTRLDTSKGSVSYYQYQWWLPNPNQDFLAQGILGQYIYVNPSKDLIIVRLGKKKSKVDWWSVFTSIANSY